MSPTTETSQRQARLDAQSPHLHQWEKIKDGTGTSPWNLDVGLSYLIKGPALRLLATYSHTYLATDTTANSVQLGAQAIFF